MKYRKLCFSAVAMKHFLAVSVALNVAMVLKLMHGEDEGVGWLKVEETLAGPPKRTLQEMSYSGGANGVQNNFESDLQELYINLDQLFVEELQVMGERFKLRGGARFDLVSALEPRRLHKPMGKAPGICSDRAMGFAPYGVYWRTLRKIADNHLFYQRHTCAAQLVRSPPLARQL
nr:AT3G61880-like protein [Ipomoea batatas]